MKFKLFLYRKRLKQKILNIKLIACDVDGVLTNGKIGYGNEVSGLKLFNVKDGLAVKILQSNEINLALISGGDSIATKRRAKSLMINECHTNIINKYKTLEEIQNRLNIPPESTLYIGDDINDLEVLPKVSLFAVPNDCNYQLKRKADIKLKAKGGEGVLREMCDIILFIKSKNFQESE